MIYLVPKKLRSRGRATSPNEIPSYRSTDANRRRRKAEAVNEHVAGGERHRLSPSKPVMSSQMDTVESESKGKGRRTRKADADHLPAPSEQRHRPTRSNRSTFSSPRIEKDTRSPNETTSTKWERELSASHSDERHDDDDPPPQSKRQMMPTVSGVTSRQPGAGMQKQRASAGRQLAASPARGTSRERKVDLNRDDGDDGREEGEEEEKEEPETPVAVTQDDMIWP
jgi:hypothetical protein